MFKVSPPSYYLMVVKNFCINNSNNEQNSISLAHTAFGKCSENNESTLPK